MRIFAALITQHQGYHLYELIDNRWRGLELTKNAYSKGFILKHVGDIYPVYILRRSSHLNNFDVKQEDFNEQLC